MPGGDSLGRRELTPEVLARWIPVLCEAGALWRFYNTPEWRCLRRLVLERRRGGWAGCGGAWTCVAVEAESGEPEYAVKTHPAWALSEFVTTPEGKRVRNLVPLCHDCHDRAHQRMGYRPSPLSAPPLTPERW